MSGSWARKPSADRSTDSSSSPPVGATSPEKRRSRVVFPDPFGPVTTRKSPAPTSRSSGVTTRFVPNRLVRPRARIMRSSLVRPVCEAAPARRDQPAVSVFAKTKGTMTRTTIAIATTSTITRRERSDDTDSPRHRVVRKERERDPRMSLRPAAVAEDADRRLAAVSELDRVRADPHSERVSLLVASPLPARVRSNPLRVSVDLAPRHDLRAGDIADAKPTGVVDHVVETRLTEALREELRLASRSEPPGPAVRRPRRKVGGRQSHAEIGRGRGRRRRRR